MSAVPVDPVGSVLQNTAPGETRNLIVATVCPNGDLTSLSITGYAVQKAPDGSGVDQISNGNAISGSLDAVQAADWSTIFVAPQFPGVGYLPLFGDNADTINTYLEHTLPFRLTPVTDTKTPSSTCQETGYALLVLGQGSLATQPLDLFRATLSAAAFSITSPNPWGIIEKFALAGVPLVAVPTRQEIGVDIFDCYDGNLYRLVHRRTDPATQAEDTKAEGRDAPLHITGHSNRLGFGTSDPGAQRRAMNDAINDLQWQVNCIVMRRLADNTGHMRDQRQAGSPTALPLPSPGSPASGPACLTYYSKLAWSPVYDAPIPARVQRLPVRL
jgi:hypothetical protein